VFLRIIPFDGHPATHSLSKSRDDSDSKVDNEKILNSSFRLCLRLRGNVVGRYLGISFRCTQFEQCSMSEQEKTLKWVELSFFLEEVVIEETRSVHHVPLF